MPEARGRRPTRECLSPARGVEPSVGSRVESQRGFPIIRLRALTRAIRITSSVSTGFFRSLRAEFCPVIHAHRLDESHDCIPAVMTTISSRFLRTNLARIVPWRFLSDANKLALSYCVAERSGCGSKGDGVDGHGCATLERARPPTTATEENDVAIGDSPYGKVLIT